MLFNSIGELTKLTGFLYSYNNFENIKTDLELAEEDLRQVVGDEIIDAAILHYKSEDFEAPNPDPVETDFELWTKLVRFIQLPVAYFAIHSFSQNTDISHEDSGRKVKIDAEHEKLPWEWMLEKDEKAILKKAHRTTDRLIAFLDKNIEVFTEWAESDFRKAIRGQFIDSAAMFNAIYPIDNSRRFFLTISPFIREAERKYILPVLGEEIYKAMKSALSLVEPVETEPTETDPDGLLPLIRVPLALFAMSIAMLRLAVEVLPEGVFQNVTSDRLTQSAKVPAPAELRHEAAKNLLKQAQFELRLLQEKIRLIAAGNDFTPADLTQGLNEDNKFARV
jgi:hypothetical protein